MTSSRRVFVTGAGGALGGHVARLLAANGDHVIGVLRPGRTPQIALPSTLDSIECDLTDRDAVHEAMARSRPDDVVHCAGLRAGADLPDLLAANLMSLANLLEAGDRGRPTRYLVVGSSAEYAEASPDHAITEDDPVDPVTPYGLSKLFQYQLSQLAHREGVPVVYARPFNLVGPGVSSETALGDFARQVACVLRGTREPVIATGDLDLERDFVDVRDVAAGCVLLLRRGSAGGAYNVCSGTKTRLGDALAMLLRLAGRPIEVNTRAMGTGMRRQRGDATRLRSLGWQPTVDLESSLRDALDYWRERESSCPPN